MKKNTNIRSSSSSVFAWAMAAGCSILLSAVVVQPAYTAPSNYAENLALLRAVTPRNTLHDNSPWRDTPQEDLVDSNHLGPRSDYLQGDVDPNVAPFWSGKEFPGSMRESASPEEEGGQFRVTCEFSHFAYDDPLVFPGKPGASHLHMFFGNTDTNAFSTYDTLINSGSSTCNGQELNRTAYWLPALFDSEGNVRIPMRAIVYYKGYGLANGRSQAYPPGAAIIAMQNLHKVSPDEGGVEGFEEAYQCSDQFRGGRTPQSNNMPICPGGNVFMKTIELHVKFPNCWNGQDPSDTRNWSVSRAGVWYYSECQDWITTPNIEYIVQYQVEEGENTDGWYLASDVNRETLEIDKPRGSTLHADWRGGWNKAINQEWLDNCVNFKIPGVPSGCGLGFLSDNGPDPENPLPGRALKLRPQYDQPQNGAPKVSATALYQQLCPDGRSISSPEDAAYCTVDQSTDPDDLLILRVPSDKWLQISLPCNPGDSSDVNALFGDDNLGTYADDWVLWEFDAANNQYKDVSLQSSLSQGVGYWFIQRSGSTKQLTMPASCAFTPLTTSPACSSASGCFNTPLSGVAGGSSATGRWQMVGYPYAKPGAVSASEVITSGGACASGCALGSIQANNVVLGKFWSYNGDSYDIAEAGGNFSPWRSYWAFALSGAGDSGSEILFPGS